LRIILVGFGVVGRALASVLATRRGELKARGLGFELVAAVDSRSAAFDAKGLDPARLLQRKKTTGRVGDIGLSAKDVIRQVESDVIVEVTPGSVDGEPALSHIREALRASRDVVTANKMPLALHYFGLLGEARRRNSRILYSACVGGGIPILEFGRDCAKVEPVDRIEGVLNATTNFILTRMGEGRSYRAALRDAQKLGFAEADASMDIDGVDAACKIVIVANHVMENTATLGDVRPLEGIRGVNQTILKRTMGRGKVIRLVASAGKSLAVRVAEVDRSDPLAVMGASNAVVYHCRYSGERVISGRAAGGTTTSLAVLRDLIALAGRVC